MAEDHKHYAQLAKDFYADKISFEDFLLSTPEDIEDPVLEKLVDLITNEPVVGENNTTQAQYDAYMKKVNAHIDLMAGEE